MPLPHSIHFIFYQRCEWACADFKTFYVLLSVHFVHFSLFRFRRCSYLTKGRSPHSFPFDKQYWIITVYSLRKKKLFRLLCNTIRHRQKKKQPRCVSMLFCSTKTNDSIHKPHFMKEKSNILTMLFSISLFGWRIYCRRLVISWRHHLSQIFSVRTPRNNESLGNQFHCSGNQIDI